MITYAQVEEWGISVSELKNCKAREETLRRAICEDIFDGRTGKFNDAVQIESEGGILNVRVKAFSVTNLKVDEGELAVLNEANKLSKEDQACFERKLAVKDGPLRKRPSDSPVWRAVTENPGMPKLEVTVI